MITETDLYVYKAKITSVYDGDTVTAEVDLGLNTKRLATIRLFGINAAEVRGAERAEGLTARDYLKSLIEGQQVYIQTIKDKTGKYGRWLGNIYTSDGRNVNALMVAKGYAVEKYY